MSLLWTSFPVDLFWGTRSTRPSWGTLPRRCCWPTRRSSTPSLTGGTSSPLGLSWCLKFLASWPGAHCKLFSQRDTIFHIWHLNSTNIFSLSRKKLIDISVIQSWMMKIRITLSLNNSKYIWITLNMSIVNTYLFVRELDTFAEEVDRKETCKTLILSRFWLL